MSRPIALVGATVWDGTGAPPRPDTTVLLRKGRIEAIAPQAHLALPDDARRSDVTGRWLMPALLDAHAHAESDEDRDRLLHWGVTAYRNPATSRTRRDPHLREVLAGPPLDHPPCCWPGSVAVTTAAQTRAAVRRQADDGVDLIKLYVRLSPDLVRAAVTEAHRLGLPVLGDLALTSWTDAARAGIDFLSHAMPRHPSLLPADQRADYLDALAERRVDPLQRWFELVDLDGPEIREMIQALADHDVIIDPTLVGVEAALGGADAPARQAVWPRVLGLVSRLHRAGITLLAGTDAPRPDIPAGESLHRELALLGQAGLTRSEALSAATAKNAAALGLSETHGLLAPGRPADLLVLAADPLEKNTIPGLPEGVYVAGVKR